MRLIGYEYDATGKEDKEEVVGYFTIKEGVKVPKFKGLKKVDEFEFQD